MQGKGEGFGKREKGFFGGGFREKEEFLEMCFERLDEDDKEEILAVAAMAGFSVQFRVALETEGRSERVEEDGFELPLSL